MTTLLPTAFTSAEVTLPGGVRLAVRRPLVTELPRPGVPFLLVHGLASNARMWDAVALRLAAAGHPVVALDQRGHGLSADLDAPASGYDTDTCADDLAALIGVLDWADSPPVVVGQSWGAQVAVSLAARHPGLVAALACVDGGWLRPRATFATFEECWAQLAPPTLAGVLWVDLERMIRAGYERGWPPGAAEAVLANLEPTDDGGCRARLADERHRCIVESMYGQDPREWFPRVEVPVLLAPAAGDGGEAPAVVEALGLFPRAHVHWYPGAHHDLHLQHPHELAADLLELAARAGTSGADA